MPDIFGYALIGVASVWTVTIAIAGLRWRANLRNPKRSTR